MSLSSLSSSLWVLELSLWPRTVEGIKSVIKLELTSLSRLASKTTDVNWTKAKDMGDHMGYYNNKQFKWFNPANVDYSNLSDKRDAPNYRE